MKKLLFVLLVAGLLSASLPFVANASGLTTQQVEAIMSLLRSFGAETSIVNNVQTALNGGQPTTNTSTSAWCWTFNKNLRIGDKGYDVAQLVTALNKEGLLSGKTDSFDEEVAAAVVGFQEKYASEVLVPFGLKRGTGFVGASTRAKLNRLYGCGNVTPVPTPIPVPPTTQPFITVLSPNGGEVLTLGSQYKIRWSASGVGDFDQVQIVIGNLATKIEKQLYDRVSSVGYIAKAQGSYIWTIPDSLLADFSATNFQSSFYIIINGVKSDRVGGQVVVSDISDSSFTITAPTTQPSITVLSPNGATYKVGDKISIQWQSTGYRVVQIYLERKLSSDSQYWEFAKINGSGTHDYLPSNGSFEWTIPGSVYWTGQTINLANGASYKIRVGEMGARGDEAVAYSPAFTITSPTSTTQPSITVLSPNGGEKLTRGLTYEVKWTSTNVNFVSIRVMDTTTWTEYRFAENGLPSSSGVPANQGYFSWTVPQSIPTGSNYKVAITDSSNSAVADLSNDTFAIAAQSSVNIKANGSDGPLTVNEGDTVTLSWTSTNATNCSSSNSTGDTASKFWLSQARANVGSVQFQAVAGTNNSNVFNIKCSENNLYLIPVFSDAVTVNVTPKPVSSTSTKPWVISVLPNIGPADGKTIYTINGSNFNATSKIYIGLENKVLTPTSVSSNGYEIRFVIPVGFLEVGTYSVKVGNDGTELSNMATMSIIPSTNNSASILDALRAINPDLYR